MSSRVFQSVIVQMKEATDRSIGVVDEQGFVIACSVLSMLGSHLDDMQAALTDNPEQIFSSAVRTYKLLARRAQDSTSPCSWLATTRPRAASAYWHRWR